MNNRWGVKMNTRKPRKKDIIGKKFNQLTVVKPTEKRRDHMIMYECKCDCGETRLATSWQLKSGEVTRCKKCAKQYKRDNLSTFHKINNMHNFDFDGSNPHIIKKKRTNSNNTSGHRGVTWSKSKKKWVAQIVFKKQAYNLGSFDDIQDAIDARLKAEEKLYEPYLDLFEMNKK